MPTQEAINAGQKTINGKLCQVDWRLLQALEKVRDILGNIPGVNAADIASLNDLIQRADEMSKEVAGDDPPGCDPKNRQL
ncbi:MAG: hypothetical protein ABJA18_13965 [bacterium]